MANKRGGQRSNRSEDALINRLDRAREGVGIGPQGSIFDEGVKKRLHECQAGDWVRQVMPGSENFGPMMRVIDPKAGLLENRRGVISKMSPRTQVVVEP